MAKKQYVHPCMETTEFSFKTLLLAESIDVGTGSIDAGNALAPEFPEVLTPEDLFGIPEP